MKKLSKGTIAYKKPEYVVENVEGIVSRWC